MSNRKRFLLLGSISMLLLVGGLFTSGFRTPIAHAAYSEPCPPSQSEGSHDPWVQVIKFNINWFGTIGLLRPPHYPLDTSSENFDSNTKDDVDWYQHTMMLVNNGGGVVGTRTWSSMGFCTGFSTINYRSGLASGYTRCPGTLADGNAGSWVQALQQILNMDAVAPFGTPPIPKTYNGDNWWPLGLDHIFGTHTRNAVEAFQSANHLSPPDGIVGNHTWDSMAMCY